jgi:hypothetical protein
MKTDTNKILITMLGALMIIGFAVVVHAGRLCELKCKFEDNYEACMDTCNDNDDDRFYDDSSCEFKCMFEDNYEACMNACNDNDDDNGFDDNASDCELNCNDNYDDCSNFCGAVDNLSEACVDECEEIRRRCVTRACQDNNEFGGGDDDGGGGGGGGGGCFINSVAF